MRRGDVEGRVGDGFVGRQLPQLADQAVGSRAVHQRNSSPARCLDRDRRAVGQAKSIVERGAAT
jgi:hypothetical protein